MSYYDREGSTHVDGTPMFKTAADTTSENEVAAILSKAWGCEICSFGEMAALDWYAVKFGRPAAFIEMKTRSHATDKYSTVFLNVRKWYRLFLGHGAFDVPAIYVVRFTDAICWIPITEVDPRRLKMGGTKQIVKSRTDYEPLIEIPIKTMHRLDV